jgi:hypothetical protein
LIEFSLIYQPANRPASGAGGDTMPVVPRPVADYAGKTPPRGMHQIVM